ncbi:MAG: hypothetical protein EXS64_21185 [Candidatus Latescibacteria bacterium]|nr:hypothetical protein [Candidatus Latescibacterota bacterium]
MSEHCYFISAGELRAIVGDDTDHGAGQDQHSGIWFLTSVKEKHTAVSQGNGVLLFGGHRGTKPSIRRVDEVTVELFKEATDRNNFVETQGTYRLVAPYYIDYEMTATAKPGHRAQARTSFSWCCYVNSPMDGGIHFIEKGIWTYYYSPVHGQGAMIFPTDLPLEGREAWGREGVTTLLDGKRGFHHSDSGHTFDHPFYFGMIRGMMFQIMADDDLGFRFFLSPSGAGQSVIPGKSSPAWDFAWEVDALKMDEPRTLRVRVAYMRPEATEAVPNGYAADHAWIEYQKFREAFKGQSSKP